MADKIINTFQQRRQLAQDLADLAQTRSEAELLDAVRRIVQRYAHDLIAPALIKHLDTPSSQLRGGLGHLASLLPPDEIGPLLRSTAANRNQNAQARITAALILERYLGETLPPALISDLSDNNEVAFQSLREAVDESRYNRRILTEYVTQMYQAGEPVAYMVMDLLNRLPPGDRVDLYRLMAMDDRPKVAQTALRHLERLAAEREPAALAALYALQSVLPPDTGSQVQRTLRKLAFGGNRYTPIPPEGWRALLSPADMAGNQSIWFIRTPTADRADGILIGLAINARAGILQAFADGAMRPDQLPPPREVGELVSVRTDNGMAALLEAPFDFCRRRLAVAQAAHWQRQPAPPLPPDYALYQDALGTLTPPQPNPTLEAYFDRTADPGPTPSWDEVDRAARVLLAHPAMSGWILHNRLLIQHYAPPATLEAPPATELAAHLVRELAQRSESAQLIDAVDEGLRCQAAWLHIAGSQDRARDALHLARLLPRLALPENPLWVRLIENSLHAAGLRR